MNSEIMVVIRIYIFCLFVCRNMKGGDRSFPLGILYGQTEMNAHTLPMTRQL